MTSGIGSQGFYMGSGSSFIKKYDLDGDGAVTAEEFDAVNNKNNNNTAASANNSDVKKEEQISKPEIDTSVDNLPNDYTFGNIISSYEKETTEEKTVYDNQTDARKAFNSIKESYIEEIAGKEKKQTFFISQKVIRERKELVEFLNTKSAAFINQYFNKNSEGPYDMEVISAAYKENIQTLLQARKEEQEKKQEEIKNTNRTALNDTIGQLVEDYSNTDEIKKLEETDFDSARDKVDAYEQSVQKNADVFVEQYSGIIKNIGEEFTSFLTNIEKEYDEIERQVGRYNTKLPFLSNDYEEKLTDKIDDAGSNISNKEKNTIFETAIKGIIVTNMADRNENGLTEEELEKYFPGASENEKYKEALAIFENLKSESSYSPKEDFEKAKSLIRESLDEVYNERTVQDAAIETIKTEEAEELEQRKNVNLSADELIDYLPNSKKLYSVTTSYYIADNKIVWTNSKMEEYGEESFNLVLELVQRKMKEQLEDLYNEDDINIYFNQAVINMAAKIENPDENHSMEEILTKTIEEFNNVATYALHENALPVEQESGVNRMQICYEAGVINHAVTGGTTYSNIGEDYHVVTRRQLENFRSHVLEDIKEQLGDDYNKDDINKIIDNAINDTVNNTQGIKVKKNVYGFNQANLYYRFFEKFNADFESYKQTNNVETQSTNTATISMEEARREYAARQKEE